MDPQAPTVTKGSGTKPGHDDFPYERKGRVLCRPCLDWSVRRPHLAGALDAAICTHCFDKGWIGRNQGTRAVTITPAGARAFREQFGARID
jgi:hypothetical protein